MEWQQCVSESAYQIVLLSICQPPNDPILAVAACGVVCVCVQICTVLDYLNTIPELKEWYTDTYPYVNNPLAMHTQLSERPETPVKTTRKVLVGGEEVEQEVESLIQQHELQAGKLKASACIMSCWRVD